MIRTFFSTSGITRRITVQMIVVVTSAILITAGLGYVKLYEVTASNSEVRIDRAARAAAAIFTDNLSSEFKVLRDDKGRPTAIRLISDTADMSLTFRDEHDLLLKEIGLTNQGAANLFRFNTETAKFDRFATTFRKPDGSMPPPMSIAAGHPAYDNLFNNRVHLGEVPVMGRLRLAYLTPIQTAAGTIAGALAVDVGWVDDLIVARQELQALIIPVAATIILIAAAFGALAMRRELKPLQNLAGFAKDITTEATTKAVPYRDRPDEVGALAHGLEHVVKLQNELSYLAYTDPLTGLGNRSRYLVDLKKALSNGVSGSRSPVLFLLDVDDFKQINDAYGQAAGDEVLVHVAEQLRSGLDRSTKLARIGPDVFAILSDNCSSIDQIGLIADSILEMLRKPLLLTAGELNLTGSIGIVHLQHDATDVDRAQRNAGLALRRAKSAGDCFTFFSSAMNDEMQDQFRLERMLRTAIRERQLDLHFQPQIDPETNGLVGLEALARWNHPIEGFIPPAKFIPIAEESGQIVDLGSYVIDQACEQAARWRAGNFDFKHISVNVSPIQLWQPDFIDVVQQALDRHNLPGSDLCIEITEGVFVDHSEERIASVLASIRAIGVSLSLDDFGSGYSSLGYLNRLPFDQLKVDRSFVSGIDGDARKQKVLGGILQLANALGFYVVVEGTETRAEVDVVQQLGCDAIQGFFFARPHPADELPDLARKIAQIPDNGGAAVA